MFRGGQGACGTQASALKMQALGGLGHSTPENVWNLEAQRCNPVQSERDLSAQMLD